MLKKLIIVIFLSFLLFIKGYAQNFMHGLGPTFSLMTGDVPDAQGVHNEMVLFTNLTWYPRFQLTSSEVTSLTVGFPIGAGVGLSTDNPTGETIIYYGFDIPVALDYNRGRKSTLENESNFGWYVGTGFGYTLTNWTDGSSNEKLNSLGPLARIGIRFGTGQKNPDRAITLGFSFKPGIDKRKFTTFGLAVLTEF